MKNIFIYVTLLLILVSCLNNESKNYTKEILQSTTPTYYKVPNDSLLYYAYRSIIPKESKSNIDYQTLNDFPNSWIGLSKNALGFFIYHRGKGFFDNFTISNDTLRNSGFGETVSWSIRDFKKISAYKYYFGLGSDTITSIYARCTMEIFDLDTVYSIQSIQIYESTETGEKLLGQYSGLYVPTHNQHMFYHIDEPNKETPDAWIPTEEINLEEFKNKKNALDKTHKR